MNTETSAAQISPAPTLEGLQHEVARLTVLVNAKDSPLPKIVITDEALAGAMEAMDKANAEALASDNPPASASLSLNKAFNSPVDLTEAQRKVWRPFANRWKDAFSDKHREMLPKRKKALDMVIRDAKSKVSTTLRLSKETGQVLSAGIRATRKAKTDAKRKNGGKKAKPAQIAAKVPAAGNAAEPAKL